MSNLKAGQPDEAYCNHDSPDEGVCECGTVIDPLTASLAEMLAGDDMTMSEIAHAIAGTAMAGMKLRLAGRARSYASDARKFREAATDGPPILGGDYDAHWAAIYSAIAQELNKIASEIPGGTS